MVNRTGRIESTSAGVDFVLVRSLAISADEAWAYLTEADRTERWFGPWEGDGRRGGTVRVRMRFEAGEPALTMRIEDCRAPRDGLQGRLELRTSDEYGDWHMTLAVEADGDDAIVSLTHHLEDASGLIEIGPGWEYYVDLLVAATEDTDEPVFDDYLVLADDYAELAAR